MTRFLEFEKTEQQGTINAEKMLMVEQDTARVRLDRKIANVNTVVQHMQDTMDVAEDSPVEYSVIHNMVRDVQNNTKLSFDFGEYNPTGALHDFLPVSLMDTIQRYLDTSSHADTENATKTDSGLGRMLYSWNFYREEKRQSIDILGLFFETVYNERYVPDGHIEQFKSFFKLHNSQEKSPFVKKSSGVQEAAELSLIWLGMQGFAGRTMTKFSQQLHTVDFCGMPMTGKHVRQLMGFLLVTAVSEVNQDNTVFDDSIPWQWQSQLVATAMHELLGDQSVMQQLWRDMVLLGHIDMEAHAPRRTSPTSLLSGRGVGGKTIVSLHNQILHKS